MKIGDYITYEDVMLLSDDEFESLLSYIQLIGFWVLRSSYERHKDYAGWSLLLDEDGDLVKFPMKWLGDYRVRVPLEEVKRMAGLGAIA